MIEENEELDLDTHETEGDIQSDPTGHDNSAEETTLQEPPKDAASVPEEPVDSNQFPSEGTSGSKSTKKKQKAKKDGGGQLSQEATRTKLSKTEMLTLQREQVLNVAAEQDDVDSDLPGPPKSKGNKKGKSLGGQSGTATPLSTRPLNDQDDQTDQQSLKSEAEETEEVERVSATLQSGTGKSKREKRREKEAAKKLQQPGPSTVLVCPRP